MDQTAKLSLYERHGVSEYWIVDTAAKRVKVYVLQEGSYSLPRGYTSADIITPAGFSDLTITLGEVFR